MEQRLRNKVLLTLLSSMLICNFTYSQHFADNWLFYNFGLKFTTNQVIIKKDYSDHQSRGVGIISDKFGNLLFYSDGFSVWNKNHQIMPNGANILTKVSSPLTQESIVVPFPGSETKYYIFTLEPFNGQATSGLYYSIVDMSLGDGLGDVISKGTRLLNNTSNKISAVFHNNRKDFWLIVNVAKTNTYYCYLIDKNGISTTPIVNTIGTIFNSSISGQLKFSTDGKKVACSYDKHNGTGADLFDFNNSTGELSNPMTFTFPVTYRGCDGVEFSSDSKKMYVYQSGSTGESGLYQLDLTINEYEKINNSNTLIYRDVTNMFRQMQLASNGYIYITKGGGQSDGLSTLAVIENANEKGNKCSVNEYGLEIGSGSSNPFTPNFVQSWFYKTNFDYDNGCQSNSVNFRITNTDRIDSVEWNFGEGTTSNQIYPDFKYNEPGDYNVKLIAHYPEKSDTIFKIIHINPYSKIELGNDRSICYGEEISVEEGLKSYLWNTGDSTRTIQITKSGTYSITVKNSYDCFYSDSINLTVVDKPTINLPDTIFINNIDSVQINAGNFKSYFWSTGATSSSIYVKNYGWYSITVENDNGCKKTKSFYVSGNNSTSKSEWELLNPLPSAKSNLDVCFIDNQNGFIINGEDIVRTVNGGQNWNIQSKIYTGNKIAFKNKIGYIIGNSGNIYKSTYMGGGWNKLNVNFIDNLNSISLINEDTIRITSNNNLFISDDGGKTWITRKLPQYDINTSCFTTSKIGSIGGSGKIMKTNDGGINWVITSNVSYIPSGVYNMYFVNRSLGFASRGHDDILRTTDGGDTWNVTSNTSDFIEDYHFIDEQNGYIVGEYGVIFNTSDGGNTWNWKGFQQGRIDGTTLYGVNFIDKTVGFAVGMGGRILKTTDGGANWKAYSFNHSLISKMDFLSDSIGFMTTGINIYKTIDKGYHWTNLGLSSSTNSIKDFTFLDQKNGYCISSNGNHYNRVSKTTDGGLSWTITNNGQDITYDELYCIYFIDEKNGFVSGSNGIVKTINGGLSWSNEYNNNIFSKIHFITPEIGYAYYYDRIYKTINGGSTWNQIFQAENQIYTWKLFDLNTIYIAGSSGMFFKTTDGGLNWQKIKVPYSYYVNMDFISKHIGYISNDYGETYKTINGGLNWDKVTKPYNVSNIKTINNNIYLYGGSGIILKGKTENPLLSLNLDEVIDVTNSTCIIKGSATSNGSKIDGLKLIYYDSTTNQSLIPDTNIINIDSTLTLNLKLKDLKSKNTYSVLLEATCNGKIYKSNILEFTTLADYYLYTSYYTVGSNNAEITTAITANKDNITDIVFQYSKDMNFTDSISTSSNTVIKGESKNVYANIQSLTENTLYNVRLKAKLNGEFIYSNIVSFKTRKSYIINVYNTTIDGANATIKAVITANKDTIKNIVLEYGKDRRYDNYINASPNTVNKNYSNYISTTLSDLDTTSVYFYRIKGELGSDIIYSDENILNFSKKVQLIAVEPIQFPDSSVILQAFINIDGIINFNDLKFEYGIDNNLKDSITISGMTYSYKTMKCISNLKNLKSDIVYYYRLRAYDGNSCYYSNVMPFVIKSKTGLSKNDYKIRVFPNPTDNYLYLQTDYDIIDVEIFDYLGKFMEKTKNTQKIDMTKFDIGIYFVRIKLNEGTKTIKVIKK